MGKIMNFTKKVTKIAKSIFYKKEKLKFPRAIKMKMNFIMTLTLINMRWKN